MVIGLLTSLGLVSAVFVFAQVDVGASVYIPREYTVDDNLVAIGVPSLDVVGTVRGDVLVLAQDVTIKGEVMGDVLVAAVNVRIEGPVHGDVRGGAENVVIAGPVDGNVTMFASHLEVTPQGSIRESLAFLAESLELNGLVGRHVDGLLSGAGSVRGAVAGDLRLHLNKKSSLVVSPEARIEGTLRYTAPDQGYATIAPQARVGSLDYLLSETPVRPGVMEVVFNLLVRFFSLLVVAIILIVLAPKKIKEMMNELRSHWGPDGLWGLAFLIGLPVVAGLVTFTVIGLPLAIILLASWVAVLYLAQVVAVLAIGTLTWDRLNPKHDTTPLIPLMLGAGVFVVLTALPGLGLLLRIIAITWGLGGMIQVLRQQLR